MSRNPLIVAADVSDPAAGEDLARRLSGVAAMMKVGLELFTAAGPAAVERVRAHLPVFLDLKLHDIPTTVGRAAANVARLGASLLSVHALGGAEMVRAAVEGAGSIPSEPPGVLAVTILSSVAEQAGSSPATLAFEAVEAGAAGIVVSGDDVAEVRGVLGEGPVLVVPGIRPAGHEHNDHARALTPAEAIEAGADFVVVGRPITGAPDPVEAARRLLREAT